MEPAGQIGLPPLRGLPRLAVRLTWVLLAVLTLGLFALSVPPHFARQIYAFPWASAGAMPQLGLPWLGYAAYVVGLDVALVLAFSLTAAAIFWRRASDWMSALVSIALLTFGAAITQTMNTLEVARPQFHALILFVRIVGVGLFLVVLYVFPDGRFVPRWTRWLTLVWAGWLVAWSLLPSQAASAHEPPNFIIRGLSLLFMPYATLFGALMRSLRTASVILVLTGWFGSGLFAQVYRFKHVSTPLQRQQTKWVVSGLTVAFFGYFGSQLLLAALPLLQATGYAGLLLELVGGTLSTLLMLFIPASILISVLRRRLWDIDPLIQRTLVYGTLTGALAALFVGSVFVFQRLFRALTGQQSDAAVVISTLAIAALFQPLRRRVQDLIDRLFYRERVDFRKAFTTFSREVRTIIRLPELVRVLVERTTDMLHIAHGAVFLYNPDGTFVLAEQRNLSLPTDPSLALSAYAHDRLKAGLTVSQPRDPTFPLLVPLTAPRTEGSRLVGVLALGPRLSGQNYSREDRTLLTGLADQAGTAITVAQLIEEAQEEARRRAEAEQRLEAHRNSPIGRAETFAQTLLADPPAALTQLHRLGQDAGHDADKASLLANLPQALDDLGAGPLARVAEGYHYLFASQFEPEMLAVGLRVLVAQLEEAVEQPASAFFPPSPPPGLESAADVLPFLQACQAALGATSIPQITHLLPVLQEAAPRRDAAAEPPPTLRGLPIALSGLQSVAEALHAAERVDTTRDKLAYLASAVERLQRMDHAAQSELSGVDRILVQRIGASWLTVLTGAMGELQTRAQIVCRLLTRHTWQGDAVPLVLSLRNDGRGAALSLRVNLAPASDYTLLDAAAQVERLAPGEETRVELRVRPHLAEGSDHFRARFIVQYTDPRGPDQVEHFADVVHLLAAEGEFRFIPNPYVVGTPLETGSALFFGREDVVAFIQENLAARHRNNLVLIGQRRTGKTSLLKQLPARLGDDYLPVYLDGQALGLDPGLPNFFLALATEIAFAADDRGFPLEPPTAEDFAEGPAAAFERDFLPRLRQAIGQRHLLIMFDEFEELETAVRRGNLDPSIFGFLRHLIQHADQLSVIFCGTRRLEELAADYWSVLFNISLYRHIGFLEKPEALRLVQEPVAEYGMRYDDLALDKVWQVTAGHPYFMQLLCHSLVNQHNRTRHSYVTVADVNAALDEILAAGEAHFVYLWAEATPAERLVLAAMSRMIPLTGHVTPVQVADYLAERGVSLERRAIGDALHRLVLRDVLAARDEPELAGGDVYRWRLGLLGLWVEKYKSLTRVMDEVRNL